MEIRDTGRKRALNMVWTAAGRYNFEPRYLFFYTDDSPSLYLNTLEGIAYTCLDTALFEPFCKGLECGREPECFRTLAQLVLEQAVYLKSCKDRSGLRSLREEYAEIRLAELLSFKRYQDMSWERQLIIRLNRILGRETPGAYKRELALADMLEETAALPDEEMIARIKQIFWHEYMYRFVRARESETVKYVGLGLFLYVFGLLFSGELTAKSGVDASKAEQEAGSFAAKLSAFWKHLNSETTEGENLDFITGIYGPCLYDENEMRVLTEACCTDYHLLSHIWYSDASKAKDADNDRIGDHLLANRSFYKANSRLFENSIRRITERLRHALEEQQEPDIVRGQTGLIDASVIYRAELLHDMALFRREIANPVPDFTIDILIDASSSRTRDEAMIAAQAYMITRSLENLNIPVQVSCFQSVRNYTVLQRMKAYEDKTGDNIFYFRAMGSNRDGLALTAVEKLVMPRSDPGDKRILLVLTDAIPMDSRSAYTPGFFRKGRDYGGELAAEDTAKAVRHLKKQGIEVAAVFLGDTYGMKFLRQIYGSSFIRIMTPEGFPDAVIGLLLKILNSLRDRGE